MSRVAFGIGAVLLWSGALALAQTPIGEPPPLDPNFKRTPEEAVSPADGKRTLELAANALQKKELDSARSLLEEFLRKNVDAAEAPEAAYKLAICHVLEEKPEEAKKAFERVANNYFQSPWGQAVLRAHLDEDALFKFAGARHDKARADNSQTSAVEALTALAVYQKRTQNKKNQEELLYRLGDCLELLGDMKKHDEAMTAVQNRDKDGTWGKLAAIRMGGADVFRKRMEELINLSASKQQYSLFLRLAERHLAALDRDERIKCEFYKACCYEGDKEKRPAILRGIVRDYPQSSWAAEAAFWLAEADFSERRYAQARQTYLNFVKAYPKSPRVEHGRRWADWLGTFDEDSRALHKILEETFARISAGKGGLALTLRHKAEKVNERLLLRVAHQGTNFLADVGIGPESLLFASNAQGSWYHGSGSSTVMHVREPVKVPGVSAKFDGEADAKNLSFKAEFGSANPSIEVSPRAIPAMVSYLQSSLHFHREIVKDEQGQPCMHLRFESAVWNSQGLHIVDVWVNQAGRIYRGRILWPGDGKEPSELDIDGIVLGDPLPDSAFAVQVPQGLAVREVDNINLFEVFGQGMRLLSVLGNKVKTEMDKK